MSDDKKSQLGFWLARFGDGEIDEVIEKLKQATDPSHAPDDGHKFSPNAENDAVCEKCGWIHPDKPDGLGCDHTVVQHAETLMNDLRDIKSGKTQPVMSVEVIVMIPRKRRPWWQFWN